VSLASGDYITMLDSDDRLKPCSLRDAVAFLKAQRPDMLLTRLLEARDIRKITAFWQGFTPVSFSQNEAIKRFLQHKEFQAHLIGQFIHRKLYEQSYSLDGLLRRLCGISCHAHAGRKNLLSTPGPLLLHQT
jgi:glycosyltransferase involved in cell wall biosynthesis